MKDHSTTASYRLHQFMRLVTLALLLLLLAIVLASSGTTLGASFTEPPLSHTIVFFVLGIVIAEILDQIMWYICEALVGENGILR